MGNRIYLVTGAAGFLGSNICLQLLEKGEKVRALVLPNDKSVKYIPKDVEVCLGDLCDEKSLCDFFDIPEGMTSVVIHCASMVTVDPAYSEKLMAVNVTGTRNIITKCLAHPECEKMVYVSSTGAIPEAPMGTKIKEVSKFEPNDPTKVVGAYSQSKAKASQMVMDSVNVMGLKACIVHPSGILGPNDHAVGETTHTLIDIIKGEMPIGMQGSFNLCDVRDLAAGCIAAVDKGRIGEAYILANEPVTLKEMCEMLQEECDLFISMIDNGDFPIHFISRCSRAKFKIGRYSFEGDPFDMIFHGGAREELRGDVCKIFEGLTEFLEKIK